MPKIVDYARRPIGIIRSGGVGPEVIDAAIRCLKAVGELRGIDFNLDFFDPQPVELRADDATLHKLAAFYAATRDAGGVILRASAHATLVYRLRQQFDLFYKLVPLAPIPELADVAVIDPARLAQFDVLLVRDNAQGPYHAKEHVETDAAGERTIRLDVTFDEKHMRRLAQVAFAHAARRKSHVHLLLKGDVHREMLAIWLAAADEAKAEFPGVAFDWDQPDCGLADLFIAPKNFDVIVAMDVDADIIGDWLAGLLHGTRALTPSANYSSPLGFASYQTVHGTCDRLAGTDKASPLGMLMAVAMMLENSLALPAEAAAIRHAIRDVLRAGHRTGDIATRKTAPAVGTTAMCQLVLDALPNHLPAVAAIP